MGDKWLNQAIRGRNRSSPPKQLSKQHRRPSPRDAPPAWDHPQERRRLVRSSWRPAAMEGAYDDDDEEDSSEDDEGEDEEEGCWAHCCGECARWQRVCAALLAFTIISALLFSLFSAAEILPPALSFAMSAPEQKPSSQPINGAELSAPDSLALGTMFPTLTPDTAQPQQVQPHLLHQQLQQQLLQQRQQQEQLQRLQEQQQQLLQHFQQQVLRPAHARSAEPRSPRQTQAQAQQSLQPLGATGENPAEAAVARPAAVTQFQQQPPQVPLQQAGNEQPGVPEAFPQALPRVAPQQQQQAQLPSQAAEAAAEIQSQAAVAVAGAAPVQQSTQQLAQPSPQAEIVSLLDTRAARTAARVGGHALGGCGKTIPLAAEGAPGGGQHRKVKLDDCGPAAASAQPDAPVDVAFDDSTDVMAPGASSAGESDPRQEEGEAAQAGPEQEQQQQQQQQQQQLEVQVQQQDLESIPAAAVSTEANTPGSPTQPIPGVTSNAGAAALSSALHSSPSLPPSSAATNAHGPQPSQDLQSTPTDPSLVNGVGAAAVGAAAGASRPSWPVEPATFRGAPSHRPPQQAQQEQPQQQQQWQQQQQQQQQPQMEPQGKQLQQPPHQLPQQPQQAQLQGQKRAKQGGGKDGDNVMATAYRACIDHTRVQRMAEHSGWPYLLVRGEHVGLVRQQEALVRALWVAKATGSVLVLPSFLKSFDAHPSQPASLDQFFNTQYLITHMYCSSEVWAVQALPSSIQEQLPAGASARDVDAILSAPGSLALSVPRDIVAGSADINNPGLLRWLETVRQQTTKGKLRLLVYDTDPPLALASPDQQRLKKNGLAALRASTDVSAVITQLLHRLRKTFQERLRKDLSQFQFAALHIGGDAASDFADGPGDGGGSWDRAFTGSGGNSSSGNAGGDYFDRISAAENGGGGGSTGGGAGDGDSGSILAAIREALLSNVDPSQMLLYVTVGRSEEHTTVLQELNAAYHVVTKDTLIPNINRRFPSHEMQAAFEQGVVKEASLFLAPSMSAFAGFIFQSRCFTRPTLGQKPLRDTVFYDQSTSAAACHLRPMG
ncbi:hypothetical protein CLOM_g5507 [Closterium sp. NIES-68]|nr:hypothetical protein CLOM_g5507 [Closterium sp. NIES-68]GJP69357.1 hypothetical protein CLOP_g292 [Closterium sp. NIES-67]